MLPALAALGITAGVFLILPLTQLMSHAQRRGILSLRQVDVVQPPPPPPPQREEKEQQEVKPELRDAPKPLTLSQLELALNPGAGADAASDFAFAFSFKEGQGMAGALEEMKIFQLSEVDKEPQLIYQAEVNYPPKLLRDRVRGTVVILFVVDETGAVMNPRVKQGSTYREFEQAAMDSVMKYKFTPGIKDGRPVRVWYEVPIVFQAR